MLLAIQIIKTGRKWVTHPQDESVCRLFANLYVPNMALQLCLDSYQ